MQARTLTTLVALALGITLATTSPAAADDTPPPVVGPDTVSLYPGQSTEIDVLDNDSSPTGDDLALCRFPNDVFGMGSHGVMALEMASAFGLGDPGVITVGAMPKAHGSHVIDYFVCDHTHLVPAALTVDIRDVQPVDVTKVRHRAGRLSVTNHNTKPIRLWFGHPRGGRADGKVPVAAGETVTIRVQRHAIAWAALIGGGSSKGSMHTSPGIADLGVVRDIKLNGAPLPAPHGEIGPDGTMTATGIVERWR